MVIAKKHEISPLVADIISTENEEKNRQIEIELGRKRKKRVMNTIEGFAPEAVNTLVDIMRLGSDSQRLKAALKILEYSIGDSSSVKALDEVKETVLTPEEYAEITSDENEEEFQRMIEAGYVQEQ